MTLNDLELCNSPYFVFFSPKSITLHCILHFLTPISDTDTLASCCIVISSYDYLLRVGNDVVLIRLFKLIIFKINTL